MLLGAVLVGAFGLRAWRHEFPIVDVRLLGAEEFSAAAATTFLVGAALFGGMLLLPLYYQVDRGLSALQAGLLLAPQGIGAAVAMRFSGQLTDRVGGGPVVVGGLLVLILGTLPFTQVTGGTPYWLLAAALVVRGVGLGFTMMPAMASAYALLDHGQVPRATPMLNVLQRVGGSIGTAVLAVVLQNQIRDATAPAGGGAGSSDIAQALPPGQRERLGRPDRDRVRQHLLVVARARRARADPGAAAVARAAPHAGPGGVGPAAPPVASPSRVPAGV